MLNLYFLLGVNRTEISGPAGWFILLARPGINILQNLYNGLTIFCVDEGQILMKILLRI